ncbi:Uncharacterised protein [Mycobacteroides abscessus subsp. abscessus]|nr:Uncharacterised protein [Mycobacteroides abscessus subsp. abscessus]
MLSPGANDGRRDLKPATRQLSIASNQRTNCDVGAVIVLGDGMFEARVVVARAGHQSAKYVRLAVGANDDRRAGQQVNTGVRAPPDSHILRQSGEWYSWLTRAGRREIGVIAVGCASCQYHGDDDGQRAGSQHWLMGNLD